MSLKMQYYWYIWNTIQKTWNKQFQHNSMHQLASSLLILLLLHVVYQMALYVQFCKPIVTFWMATVVKQCENFLFLILHRMILAIDNLFEVSLCTSFLGALRIIIDGFGSSIVKINEFRCGYDSDINITMILSNFGHNTSRIEAEIFYVVIIVISIYHYNGNLFSEVSYMCISWITTRII